MKKLDASSFENQFYVVFSHLKNVLNEEKRKRCHQAGFWNEYIDFARGVGYSAVSRKSRKFCTCEMVNIFKNIVGL